MGDFADFVLRHADDDTDRLLLNRDKYAGTDVRLAVSTILCRKKLRTKVPSFYANPELIYPDRLAAEQCSSEAAAACKTEIIKELCAISDTDPAALKIADLTGGLGVDCAAFAKIAGKVLYNEMNPVLAGAAGHNFKALRIGNIEISNCKIAPEGSPDGISPKELLGRFGPDIIFLDPARRAPDGRKVFLLEDCSPDIMSMLGELLEISRFVVVKLSPMADIGMVSRKFGRRCRSITAISTDGECRELVAAIDREYDGECTVTANCGGKKFSFTAEQERGCAPAEAAAGGPEEGMLLLEPDKALMKAAPFNLLGSRFRAGGLGRGTHYYTATETADTREFSGFFKIFKILKVLPLDKRGMKEMSALFPCAEVTARNIPLDSDTLRKRLRVSPSDEYHIFGLKTTAGNLLIATRRLPALNPAPVSDI